MASFIPSKHEANEYNNGVQYVGQNTAQGIQGDAVQAQTINNLVESALYAQDNAEQAKAIADSALTVVSEANDKSVEALSTAQSANTKADNAISTANQAYNTANSAKTTADTANSNASSAKTTAETANSNASSAKTTAESANATAKNAETVANNALDKVNDAVGGIALSAYPIGSIYLSYNSNSPANLFGGSWLKIAEGRTLIGANDTYSLGSTGGETNYYANIAYVYGFYLNQKGNATRWQANNFIAGEDSSGSSVTRTQGVPITDNTGSNTVMPPYLAVNIWRRTA